MEPVAAVIIDKGVKKAKAGFILGLVGILAWLLPIVGLPVTLCGIVFSAMGLSSSARGKARAGLILSVIFLVLTILNAIAGAALQVVSEKNEAALQETQQGI